jgi:hypothetical protein
MVCRIIGAWRAIGKRFGKIQNLVQKQSLALLHPFFPEHRLQA